MVKLTDIFITPARPSQADLSTLETLCGAVKHSMRVNPSMRSYLVLTMSPTNPQITEVADAKEFAADYPALTLTKQIICDRKAYRECLSSGYGVSEYTNEKASEEIINLVGEIYGF